MKLPIDWRGTNPFPRGGDPFGKSIPSWRLGLWTEPNDGARTNKARLATGLGQLVPELLLIRLSVYFCIESDRAGDCSLLKSTTLFSIKPAKSSSDTQVCKESPGRVEMENGVSF